MSGFSDYDRYDGLGLSDLVRQKQVSPSELVEEAISRIERLNPQINAVIHKMYGSARRTAETETLAGPFQGVPFLLKDLLAPCAGAPMCAGSRFHGGFVPDHDAEMVRRYKAAGLIILGKTNTPEYGLVPVTEPEVTGPTHNPWDLSRTPGGSSGGSAAAVAAGMVPMAHGNDGGGSIRIPASCCGLFGLKPSRGRNPIGPAMAEAWHGMSSDHVLTRSVRDSAAMLDATAGMDTGASYSAPAPSRPFLDEVATDPKRLRIAFTGKPFLPSKVHPECIRGLEATVKLCQDLGHEVAEAAPDIDGAAFATAFLTMVCSETRADIEEAQALLGRKATHRDFEAATWAVGLLGQQCRAIELSRALRYLKLTARETGRFFQDYDVLLTPTLARPPVKTGEIMPRGIEALGMKVFGRLNAGWLMSKVAGIEAQAAKVFDFMPFTPVFNATGQPAMSVPLHWSEKGLPVGMQFVGRYGDEATLFRLAGQLERARPWADRKPPVIV